AQDAPVEHELAQRRLEVADLRRAGEALDLDGDAYRAAGRPDELLRPEIDVHRPPADLEPERVVRDLPAVALERAPDGIVDEVSRRPPPTHPTTPRAREPALQGPTPSCRGCPRGSFCAPPRGRRRGEPRRAGGASDGSRSRSPRVARRPSPP